MARSIRLAQALRVADCISSGSTLLRLVHQCGERCLVRLSGCRVTTGGDRDADVLSNFGEVSNEADLPVAKLWTPPPFVGPAWKGVRYVSER